MATDDPIRASDSDREVVVTTLRDAYTAGRLTLDEFDERMTAAYEGKTWGDLRKLTEDLPSQPVLGGDIPGRQLPAPVRLPAQPPQANLTPPRRHRPVAILIPVTVWTLLALHSGSGHGAAFLVITLVLLTILVSAVRRR
jgi:hypothetical protein